MRRAPHRFVLAARCRTSFGAKTQQCLYLAQLADSDPGRPSGAVPSTQRLSRPRLHAHGHRRTWPDARGGDPRPAGNLVHGALTADFGKGLDAPHRHHPRIAHVDPGRPDADGPLSFRRFRPTTRHARPRDRRAPDRGRGAVGGDQASGVFVRTVACGRVPAGPVRAGVLHPRAECRDGLTLQVPGLGMRPGPSTIHIPLQNQCFDRCAGLHALPAHQNRRRTITILVSAAVGTVTVMVE